MSPTRPLLDRLPRLVFCGMMLLVWTARPSGTAVAQVAPAGDATASSTQPDMRLAGDTDDPLVLLGRAEQAGRRLLADPAADPSDVWATASRLGFDPQRLYALVRDEIRFEPYQGVLRGGPGALAASAGNSADKAMLLSGLLEASGYRVRLVRGKLTDATAHQLVADFLASEPIYGPLAELGDGPIAVDAQVLADLGLTQQAVKTIAAEDSAIAEQFLEQVWQKTDPEANFLIEQLTAAGLTLGRPHGEWVDLLASRVADHWWVEAELPDENGSASWVTLDPSAPKAEFGKAYAEPTVRIGSEDALALENADRHYIQFQLVYRFEKQGETQEQVLIDQPLYADETLLEPVTFQILPAEPLPSFTELGEMGSEAAIQKLLGVTTFQAVLGLGDRRWSSLVFDLEGNFQQVSNDGRVKAIGEIGNAVGNTMGGLMGGMGAAPEEAAGGKFLDLTVHFTIHTPGESPHTQARTLLDTENITGDFRMSPMLDWKLSMQPAMLPSQFMGYQQLRYMLPLLSAFLGIANEGTADAAALDRVSQLRPNPVSPLLTDMILLRQAGVTELAQAGTFQPLCDRVQLILTERRFCGMVDGSSACGQWSTDIVDNTISFVPRTPETSVAAAEAALRQGVFDTALEAALLRSQTDYAKHFGALSDLAEARTENQKFTVTSPADVTGLRDADAEWVRANEREDVRIVAPQVGGLAWWSVDPTTGTTLGRRDRGRGQDYSEYMVQLVNVGICMIGVLYIQNEDIKKQGGGKLKGAARDQSLIGMGACLVGLGIGSAGVKVAAAGKAAGAGFLFSHAGAISHAFNIISGAVGTGFNVWNYKAGS